MTVFFINFSTAILFLTFFMLLKVSYKKFKRGGFSVAFAGAGALFFFLGLPIFMDVFFGEPDFSRYKGFYKALNSPETTIYYNLYISYICLIFTYYIKNNTFRPITFDAKLFQKKVLRFSGILWLLLVLPLFAVMFYSPRPYEYLDYQAVLSNRDILFRDAHTIIARLSLLAVVAGSLLLFLVKRGRKANIGTYIVISIFLVIAFWLDGKRGIYFKFFLIFLVVGTLMGNIKPKRIFRYILIGLSSLAAIVLMYGKDFSADNQYERDSYSSLRINTGRDHTVKFTLYKEFVENDQILEYRGQSFLFVATFFIPRAIWSEKPYPYAVYYISSVLEVAPEPQGWSFTTCILEEMISNLGFLGMIIAPFFLIWICKIGDKTTNKFLTVIATICVVFYLFTQMAAFLPILCLFIILLLREKFKKYKFE